MGKFVLVSFILAQLERRQNSAPSLNFANPLLPKMCGYRGVSMATPRYHGGKEAKKKSRRSWLPTCRDGSLEARTGCACQAGHVLPPS